MLYRKLKPGHQQMIVPPIHEGGMVGVRYLTQNREGVVTLHYSDGSTESASLPDVCLKTDHENETFNLFEMVRLVQEKARA